MAQQENLTTFRLGSRPELDGMRGLSVLAVMAWHAGLPFVAAGNIGVDVFFVLSGFLITILLWQEWSKTGAISLKNFYMRRALRLLPVLFVVLLLFALYAAFFQTSAEAVISYKYILATLLYVANWVQVVSGLHHPVLGHTWSLAIEEQFYILYPLLLLGFLRLKKNYRWLLLIFAVTIAVVFLNRIWLWEGKESYDRLNMSLDTRADALLIGCLVGVLTVNRRLPNKAWSLILLRVLAFGSALLLCWFVIGGVKNEVYYRYGVVSLTAVCVAVIIADLMGKPSNLTRRLLQNPVLVWIGRLSYGLYLWHIPVFFMIGQPALWSGITIQTVRFAAVFVVAASSYYFIEQPFLNLKNKFSAPEKTSGEIEVYSPVKVPA